MANRYDLKRPKSIIPENYLNILLKGEMEHTFRKGELICGPETSEKCFFIIIEGYACNFNINIDGKEFINGISSVGDIIGLINVFVEERKNIFSRALTDVKVVSICREKLKFLIKQDSLLAVSLLEFFSEANHGMLETLQQIIICGVDAKKSASTPNLRCF
jgi:CRP/FNR family transcriptional regulator